MADLTITKMINNSSQDAFLFRSDIRDSAGGGLKSGNYVDKEDELNVSLDVPDTSDYYLWAATAEGSSQIWFERREGYGELFIQDLGSGAESTREFKSGATAHLTINEDWTVTIDIIG